MQRLRVVWALPALGQVLGGWFQGRWCSWPGRLGVPAGQAAGSRERSCSPPTPGSRLHRSMCPYVNTAASRAGLDLRVPLGLTDGVNISPGTLRRPQKARLHLEAQGGLLQQTVSETSRRLALLPVYSQPVGTGIFFNITDFISFPTVWRSVKNIYFPGF